MRFALVLVCAGLSLSGQQISEPSRESLYARPEMPGVFLSYVRTDPRLPKGPAESSTGVWLRLTNNLKVPIVLFAFGDLDSVTPKQAPAEERQVSFFKDGAEVGACYDVEGIPHLTSRWAEKGIEMEIPVRASFPEPSPTTSCLWFRERGGLISLAPRNTVIFSVPENFVTDGRRIATKYAYEWELDEHRYRRDFEPAHFVYFWQ